MSLFDFSIDLAAFEAVIGDQRALEAFNAKQGRELRRLFALYEGAVNGMKVFEPMPPLSAVRALQMTFYDNGEVKPPTNRSKAPRPMKTRFNIDLRCWTRAGKIDFSTRGRGQIAWTARAYLWSADEAMAMVEHNRKQKMVTQATVDEMQRMIAHFAKEGVEAMFAVPVYRRPKIAGGGLKWFDGTIMAVTVTEGVPSASWLLHPEQGAVTLTEHFSGLQATGEAFTDLRERIIASGKDDPNFTHQARLDLTADHALSDWCTESLTV